MAELLASAESRGTEVEWCPECSRVVVGVVTEDEDGLECPACQSSVAVYERWTELKLFGDGEEFLLEILGHSAVPGETLRKRMHSVRGRDQLIWKLRNRGRLTSTGRDLLAKAGLAME